MPADTPPADTVPLGRPLDMLPPDAPADLLAGRYQLGRCVGTGGMGEVYEAEQLTPVRRTVAVKLVRRVPDGYDIADRMEAERQALARMAHPNIAVVHDGGTTPDGRPFVVMEFVHGVPLTEYAEDRKLGLRERLELVRQICIAVQHAHQKGIIHRDLKPGNVLVAHTDAGPVPKVIDFGLAKAVRVPLTDARMTTAGVVLGTPLYMAPEQTDPAADVDTRADVYALGVILFELLTGETPLDRRAMHGADFGEQLRRVRATFAPAPSTKAPASVARQIRGDLDAVTLQALARHPDDRYPTAAALAEDLGHVLADEPVSIGRTTVRTRVKRFVRRNRAAVATAALVFVALAGGGAMAAVGLVKSRAAEADTRDALRQVETQSAALAAALGRVEAERTKAEVARGRAVKALEAAADLNTAALVARSPQLSNEDREHLNRLATLIAGLDADAATPDERAGWLARVGYLYEKLGDQPKAADAYARAVAVCADPLLKADKLQLQARHFVLVFRLPEAEKAYRDAVALATPHLPRPDVRAGLMDAHEGLATVLMQLRRTDEAKAEGRAVVALADGVRKDGASLGLEALTLSRARTTLGMLASAEGKNDEYLAHYRAALDDLLTANLDRTRPAVIQKLATAHLNLAPALSNFGRFKEAVAASREAVRVAEDGLSRYPGFVELRVVLGTATSNLGGMLLAVDEMTEALVQFNRAIDLLTPVADRPGPESAPIRLFLHAALIGRGGMKANTGDFDGAHADYRRGLDALPAEDRDRTTMFLAGQSFRNKQPQMLARLAEGLLAQDVPGSADRAAYLFAMCTLLDLPPADLNRYTTDAIRAIRRVPPGELPKIGVAFDAKMAAFRKRPGVADALAGKRPEVAPPPRARN